MIRGLLGFVFVLLSQAVAGAEINVSSPTELVAAVRGALPGDIITMAPGVYETRGIRINSGGAEGRPITLRAENLGEARIASTGVVAIQVSAPHWHFENLDIVGQCKPKNHRSCEHAFHIFGDADGV